MNDFSGFWAQRLSSVIVPNPEVIRAGKQQEGPIEEVVGVAGQ